MDKDLFRYIWRHSKKEQFSIVLLVLFSLPFYFFSLDIPKTIVNKTIQGTGFPTPESTAPFMKFDLPDWLGGGPLFGGFEMDRITYLFALSLAFLVFVCINGLFKYQINTQKGRMGERMLRRLRFELFDRILRFPPLHFRRVKQTELATMIKDEVEPLGGFIGDAFVQPVFQGGMALTALIFIMAQSLSLGMVALGIVLMQAFLIPRLREPIRLLGKQRQLAARHLAGRVGEVADGIVEIHSNDTSAHERADMAQQLGKIFWIRYEIYQRKFFVKFLNNFLAQFTPFLFYAIGGYFAITGSLDVGQLVAVLVAYKDLPSPIKELINWDQQRLDTQIKYEQVVEQFDPPGMIDPEIQDPDRGMAGVLEGVLALSSVSAADDSDEKLLEHVSAELDLDKAIAVVGEGVGPTQLGNVLGRMLSLQSGQIKVADQNLTTLPEAVTGRRMAYVGQDAYFFPFSLRENMTYVLKHRPMSDEGGYDRKAWDKERKESQRTGNIDLNPYVEWIDHTEAGVEREDQLTGRLIDVLSQVDLIGDVYQFGLRGTIDPEALPDTAAALLRARKLVRENLKDPKLANLIEPFDPDKYNLNSSISDNLLFGTPVADDFSSKNIASNAYLLNILEQTDLKDDILRIGHDIAETMVEIFADLPPGHPFFEQFSFITSEELPEYKLICARAAKGDEEICPEDEQRIMALSFDYIEARHRLGHLDDALMERIVVARKAFRENLPDNLDGHVAFFDPDAYNGPASLLDNILFGRISDDRAEAEERIETLVAHVLEAEEVREQVMEVGLEYNLGSGGRRLAPTQRQRLALARSLLRSPDILIVNEALAVVDSRTQETILKRLLENRKGKCTIFVLHRAEQAMLFDHVLVFDGPRLVESGSPQSIAEKGGRLKEMIAAE